MVKNIERSALGRSGHLGAVYDCRTDSFQGDNIFNSKIEEDDIYLTELGNTRVELLMSDSLEEKFHKLNIEAELSVSILSGMIKLSGHGKFLEEKRSSAKRSTMSLIYQVVTTTEEVYLRQLKNMVELDALETTEATHILTSIDWGAVCTVTAEYDFSDADEKKLIEGGLKAELNKLKGVIDELKGEGSVTFDESLKGKSENFKFFSKCDVGNRGEDLPVTFQEAVEQAKKLPSLVQATNGGKGVPLKFIFTPISTIKKWFKKESAVNVIFKTIEEEALNRVVFVAQNMIDIRQKLTDLHNDIMKGKEYISETDVHEITDLTSNFNSEDARFRDELQILLKDIRSGNKDMSELSNLTSKLENGSFSPTKMDEEMAKWDKILNKIAAVEKAESKGVQYFGKAAIVNVCEAEEMYIFYTDDLLSFSEAQNFFWNIQKCTTNAKMCIFDLSLNPNSDTELKDKIVHYKEGQKISDDTMTEFGNGSLIQFSESQFCKQIPNNRARVTLSCPAKCSQSPKEWLCSKCHSTIWYGIKTKKFYCEKCKEQLNPEAGLYRCDEIQHGFNYCPYSNQVLFSELDKLRESKQMNILILGETGVGKSTFINAFANYLYFDSLENALEGNRETPIVAIPSKFTITDDDGESVDIFIGKENVNEVHDTGVSNTQGTRSYPFPVGDTIVNLIDTPGIGDTRGSEQDDKNMDDILAHITYYDEIHGILVLLKPNNARLGITFQYCIQQLMAHLHRDSGQNITFVFTNARSTQYRGGDTLPPLKKLLKDRNMGIEVTKHNLFYFDNEAFRYLACVLQDPKFGHVGLKIYKESWELAFSECERLFEYIGKLNPHQVKNTTTLNDSRRIIVELSRPLQQFAETIQKTIDKVNSQQEEISEFDNCETNFQSQLNIDGFDLEQKSLENPRTVCTHTDCTEQIEHGKDGIRQPKYRTCDPYCGVYSNRDSSGQRVKSRSYSSLTMIDREVTGADKLKTCWAMNANNNCRFCEHHYTSHMHRTYDLELVRKTFISATVQAKIDNIKDKKERARVKKQEAENVRFELEAEEAKVKEVAAFYAVFLKTYAIIPFNDAMGQYLEQQIKVEESKGDYCDKKKLEIMKQSKGAYEHQKEIIVRELAATGDTSEGHEAHAQRIKDLRSEVCNMKHYGDSMKAIFTQIEASKQDCAQYKHGHIPVAPKSARKNRGALAQTWDNFKQTFLGQVQVQ